MHRGWASDDDDDADRYTNYGYSDFGIWSIAWSPQGGQLVAGGWAAFELRPLHVSFMAHVKPLVVPSQQGALQGDTADHLKKLLSCCASRASSRCRADGIYAR
jgi:hypothetical protein